MRAEWKVKKMERPVRGATGAMTVSSGQEWIPWEVRGANSATEQWPGRGRRQPECVEHGTGAQPAACCSNSVRSRERGQKDPDPVGYAAMCCEGNAKETGSVRRACQRMVHEDNVARPLLRSPPAAGTATLPTREYRGGNRKGHRIAVQPQAHSIRNRP